MKFKMFLVALIFFNYSCTPKYSATATAKTTTTWGATDALYEKIMLSPDKDYTSFTDGYDVINSEIDDLVTINDGRKNAKVSQKIIRDIKSRFMAYQDEHKSKGVLNNVEAKVNKNGMDALWRSLYNTELNLNR